jgi:hypothetical protein
MGIIRPSGAPRLARIAYRVSQFLRALTASWGSVAAEETQEAQAVLPEQAWGLFSAMPRQDQRHSLRVLRTLRRAGWSERGVLQAALLHDAAKRDSGLSLLHRVAIVLLKAFWPSLLVRWATLSEPARADPRFPFWAHAHHPERGAERAAAAGCDPLAVSLIRRHQEHLSASGGAADRALAALQAADDDN